jgi:hypothetical protein
MCASFSFVLIYVSNSRRRGFHSARGQALKASSEAAMALAGLVSAAPPAVERDSGLPSLAPEVADLALARLSATTPCLSFFFLPHPDGDQQRPWLRFFLGLVDLHLRARGQDDAEYEQPDGHHQSPRRHVDAPEQRTADGDGARSGYDTRPGRRRPPDESGARTRLAARIPAESELQERAKEVDQPEGGRGWPRLCAGARLAEVRDGVVAHLA